MTEGAASHGLIIRLIIQRIRRDPTGFVWIDEALNVSRPDPSGPDQIDAEHQATDVVLDSPTVSLARRHARDPAPLGYSG